VVHALVAGLVARGHAVTTFASGDSDVPGELVRTVPAALRPTGFTDEATEQIEDTVRLVLRQAERFDLIHAHLEWRNLDLMAASPVPVVATFHGRIDRPGTGGRMEGAGRGLVAISRHQASIHPRAPWETVVYNGLDLSGAPVSTERTGDLCFVGRLVPEKGILDALEVERQSGRRLVVAAKVGTRPHEVDYFEQVVKPAFARADVEFLGELPGPERDALLARSFAAILPHSWPEPFGLVAIEALACGTPVVARRVGALPEIIREGVDGWFGDDVAHMVFRLEQVEGLDRRDIRRSVLDRFSAQRMVDGYEAVYRSLVEDAPRIHARPDTLWR
jgi:glycosyltransferase involved in cell wall biosynthesis